MNLRAKFENLARQGEEEVRKKAEEERDRRKKQEDLEERVAREQEEKRLKKQLEKEQEQQRKLQEHKLYLEQTVSQSTSEHRQVSCKLLSSVSMLHKCLIVHEPTLEKRLS